MEKDKNSIKENSIASVAPIAGPGPILTNTRYSTTTAPMTIEDVIKLDYDPKLFQKEEERILSEFFLAENKEGMAKKAKRSGAELLIAMRNSTSSKEDDLVKYRRLKKSIRLIITGVTIAGIAVFPLGIFVKALGIFTVFCLSLAKETNELKDATVFMSDRIEYLTAKMEDETSPEKKFQYKRMIRELESSNRKVAYEMKKKRKSDED